MDGLRVVVESVFAYDAGYDESEVSRFSLVPHPSARSAVAKTIISWVTGIDAPT
jgi:hypothetical protein